MAVAEKTETITRDFPGFGTLTFEEQDRWRAYYWQPSGSCEPCEGSGRIPGKRAGTTRKCDTCDSTGTPKRQRLTSVTTILNKIVPKDLSRWGEARGIEGVMTLLDAGDISRGMHPDIAIDLVRSLGVGADGARNKAAGRGTDVHALLEEYMVSGDIPNLTDHPVEQRGYVQSLCQFILKHDPQPLDDGTGIEQIVCDPINGYAGRRDLVCTIGGKVIALDAKTNEKGSVFAGSMLQLALYERAGRLCGDQASDEQWILALPASGTLPDPVISTVTQEDVEVALRYWRMFTPLDSMCASRNRKLSAQVTLS